MQGKRLSGRRGVARRKRWLALHPLCKHCAEANPTRITLAVTPDHIVPLHKGGADDDSNLQSLCASCHAIKTAADLGHKGSPGCDASGWPTDPRHPWNQKA